MFNLFKSKPSPYVEKRGYLRHKSEEALSAAVIRIYTTGNIVVFRGEYICYEAEPIDGSPTRFKIVGNEPYYREFFTIE